MVILKRFNPAGKDKVPETFPQAAHDPVEGRSNPVATTAPLRDTATGMDDAPPLAYRKVRLTVLAEAKVPENSTQPAAGSWTST